VVVLCRKHLSSTKVGRKAIRAGVTEYFKRKLQRPLGANVILSYYFVMNSLWQVRSWRVPIHTDLSLVAGPIMRLSSFSYVLLLLLRVHSLGSEFCVFFSTAERDVISLHLQKV